MNSFNVKQLRVKLILAGTNAVFPGTNNNTLELKDLRMSAQVQAVARLATQCELEIYGMLQKDMNALTVAWANPPIILNNEVILEANDSGDANAWKQVFKGTIIEAQPDYRSAPNVAFKISAVTGYFQKVTAATPTSYPYAVDIGAAVSDIVDRMGAPWTYVDGGATGVISNPYFWGSLWDQLAQACQAANADFYVQGDEILITESGLPRNVASSVILTPETGLVGYPMFERAGLNVMALFNAALTCGSPLDVTSVVPNATGRWYPYGLTHTLESRTPRGQWFTQMFCTRVL